MFKTKLINTVLLKELTKGPTAIIDTFDSLCVL